MSAPRHLNDALECVVSLFFSNVRHNYRAAFILCDELVEVTCREKIKSTLRGRPLGHMTFHSHVTHQQVGFDVNTPGLGKSIMDCHNIRNDMQHNNAAATVDEDHCADAILDAVHVMDHCFPGSSAAFPERLKIALRVVGLYGQHSDTGLRNRFADAMRNERWRTQERSIRVAEIVLNPGDRQHWHLVLLSEFQQIEAILNRITTP